MKKSNKPRTKVIKELAGQFEADLNSSLPISVQPDGSIVYKTYLIKKNKQQNWGVYNIQSGDLIEQFYLKTCALVAAKHYFKTEIEKLHHIKRLDNCYWANYTESIVFRNNMKKTKEFERFLILLNKLENSEAKATAFKDEISKIFKWSFV